MERARHFLLICFLLPFIQGLHAQDNQSFAIDSIRQVLPSQQGQEKVNSYNELSWYYRNFNVDSALVWAQLALQEAIDESSDASLASAYNSVANCYEALGKLDSAEYYFKGSLEKKLILGDSLKIAQTLNNLGILYDEMGLFSKSLENYFASLKLFENHSDNKFDVAMVLGNIGIVYKKQKAYDQVFIYYERALDIYKEIGSKFGQVVTQGNMGSVLINLERYQESIDYSEQALEGYEALGYTRYVPYMQHNIGVARDSLGELEDAEAYLLKALDGHKGFQNTYELSNTLTALAWNNLKQNKPRNALKYAEEGLEYGRQANSADFQVNALKYLAEANARLGRYAEAYMRYKAYALAKDSLFEKDKTQQIFELTTAYETDKKEQEIAFQRTALGEQSARLQRNQAVIIGLLAVAALLVFVVFQVRRARLKEKRLILQESELKLREAEMNAVISSQEKERNRFAKDLHDGFGQMISVLKLNLSRLGDAEARDTEKRMKIFEAGESVINDMYTELRNICFDLMPQTLVKKGLAAALQEFGERIHDTGKVNCEVLIFEEGERLSELVEVSLFRIVQEWTNNVLKYANPGLITIQLTREGNEATLTVEDDGKGFNTKLFYDGVGNGWKNVQSRLKLVNGTFDLDSTPGMQGTMMTVDIVNPIEYIPTGTDMGLSEAGDSVTTP